MPKSTSRSDSPLPGGVRFEEGPKGFRRLAIHGSDAEARIYLHGAQVAHFRPHRGARDHPLLFMSRQSCFDTGQPIRGGVPVIFPWFGSRRDTPSAPAHGLARIREWALESATQTSDGAIAVTLVLEPDEGFRSAWPFDFLLRYRVEVGAALTMALEVTNRSPQCIRFEEALHTYFAVSDIRHVTVDGLHGPYVDTVGGRRDLKEHGPGPIHFEAETDRIYPGHRSRAVIRDPAWERYIVVEKSGSDATVLWNPWAVKARAMPDFGDDEWPSMLCIETGNVGDQAVSLPPGQIHRMQAVIHAEEASGNAPS